MYGHPFLLENLPPTDPDSLADYLPYLNLLRELLREHVEQILLTLKQFQLNHGILFS
jgi:hypothetical protein